MNTENRQKTGRSLVAVGSVIVLICVYLRSSAVPVSSEKSLDPAAWGSDHVGKALPTFDSGDECLFCHREKVGPGWATNRHNLTLRPANNEAKALAALKATADDVTFVLGGKNRLRFLKPSKDYGKLDLLSAAWSGKEGKLVNAEKPHWDTKTFGDSCAG